MQSYCMTDQSNEHNAPYAARAQQCKLHEAQRSRLECSITYKLTTQAKRLLQEHVAVLVLLSHKGGVITYQPDHILASHSCEQLA